MFMSSFEHKLDSKGRVSVPALWRLTPGALLYLVDIEVDGAQILRCYTEEGFARMLEDVRVKSEARNVNPVSVDRYIGKIAAQSLPAEVSSQGKLLLPKNLRDKMKVQELVYFVGRASHFEIWEAEAYKATLVPKDDDCEDLDKIFGILS